MHSPHCLLPIFLLGITFCWSSTTSGPLMSFFHISDVHLLQDYNPSDPARPGRCKTAPIVPVSPSTYGYYGRYGCDPPALLLQTALAAMKSVNPDPDFLLFGGDLAAHGGTSDATAASIADVIQMSRKAFPDKPFVFTVGNNDFFPRYSINVSMTGWLSVMSSVLEDIFPDKETQALFRETGYYSIMVTPKLKVISLNTVLYSPIYEGYPPKEQRQAEQFVWLEKELQHAQQQDISIYIMGHIPPASIQWNNEEQWRPEYIQLYFELIKQFPRTVLGQFFSHTHRDDFKVYTKNTTTPITLLLCPSISPNSNTNPSWRVFFANRTTNLPLNYLVYFADLLEPSMESTETLSWTLEYDFDNAYHQKALDGSSLLSVFYKLRSNPMLFAQWVQRYSVQYSPERLQYLCAIFNPERDAYMNCINTTVIKSNARK